VRVADLDGQPYLARINCEYFDALRDVCRANGSRMIGSFRSEREDWILTMAAAGMGVCFLPEFSNTIPGVISRHVVDPEVVREVSLVTVAGRRWSSPVAAFVRAVKQYRWPEPADSLKPAASAWQLVAAE
jgi:DNA-binding transcriptional LysR family regulator